MGACCRQRSLLGAQARCATARSHGGGSVFRIGCADRCVESCAVAGCHRCTGRRRSSSRSLEPVLAGRRGGRRVKDRDCIDRGGWQACEALPRGCGGGCRLCPAIRRPPCGGARTFSGGARCHDAGDGAAPACRNCCWQCGAACTLCRAARTVCAASGARNGAGGAWHEPRVQPLGRCASPLAGAFNFAGQVCDHAGSVSRRTP